MGCPTAVELYKNVAERGKWGELMMEAHADYRRGRYDEALLKYLLLAELGYEVAQSNAAYILDRKETELYNAEEMWKRALVYWSRAAAQGYSAARVRLGDYFYLLSLLLGLLGILMLLRRPRLRLHAQRPQPRPAPAAAPAPQPAQ